MEIPALENYRSDILFSRNKFSQKIYKIHHDFNGQILIRILGFSKILWSETSLATYLGYELHWGGNFHFPEFILAIIEGVFHDIIEAFSLLKKCISFFRMFLDYIDFFHSTKSTLFLVYLFFFEQIKNRLNREQVDLIENKLD